MGLFTHHILPAPPPEFESSHALWPGLQQFFITGVGLGLDQVTTLTTKWGKDDWWACVSSQAAVQDSLKSLQELAASWYASHDPLTLALAFCVWSSTACFVLQELTNNLSQVDRVWTFLPVIYSAHLTFHQQVVSHGFNSLLHGFKSLHVPKEVDPRMLLVFGLQCLWSARLTRNAFYRGFFNFTEEDYRWPIVRRNVPKWFLHIFGLTFIALYQNFLLLSTALPQYFLLTTREHAPAFGWPDCALAALTLGFLVLEQLGDSQQQSYQTWKRSPQATQESFGDSKEAKLAAAKLARGFRTDGLWAWSRHPNFACEQLHWICLYLFTLRVTLEPYILERSGQFVLSTLATLSQSQKPEWSGLCQFVKEAAPYYTNYAALGPALMVMLFYSSTILTERISAGKYSRYAAYQRRVGMFWPPMTTLKGVYLWITGQLSSVNETVFGYGRPVKGVKKN